MKKKNIALGVGAAVAAVASVVTLGLLKKNKNKIMQMVQRVIDQ